MIVSLVPPKVFLANTAPYLLFSRGTKSDEAYVLGVLSSIVFDWYCRRFVERHVNFFLLNPMPVPRGENLPLHRSRVVALAGRLAALDDRFADWAKAVGVAHGPLIIAEKQDMIHELDAVVARLYGLSESQLTHVFETFHEGWDYEPRLKAVLKHFAKWKNA